ncbi:MAG: sasA 14 [Anaerospora sp.]|nr:sasA 14 [Anaerospora sp.]
MDFLTTFAIAAIAGTFSMTIVYLYLYMIYRDRFMSVWTISWFILLIRLVIFDSGIINWMQSAWGFIFFAILLLASASLFIWATHLFINKPLNKMWVIGSVGVFIISVVSVIADFPFFYKLLPVAWYCGLVCIWAGIAFMSYLNAETISKKILGYSYIAWGIHTLDMPFLIDVAWFAPYGYIIEGLLRLCVAIASLLLYLEKARLNLAQKESQYRLLAENAVDIIYLYKVVPKAKVEYISPAVAVVTGYVPEDYYKDANLLTGLIHPEDKLLFDNFVENLPELGALPLTLRIICKDQTICWIEQNIVPVYDQAGKLVALEGIIRDVTARKNLEQSMSRLDRMNMIGEMAANVAHEIRNPLTTVRGYLQIMGNKQEFLGYKDRFELMIGELDRTNAIIREYLSLAKNKMLELKHHDLNNSITSLLPLLEADAIATKASVTLSLANIPQIFLDENEIRQLLLNLVRNGLEAMPSGGNLHISTYVDNEQVVLSVADQGSGIPLHILENLGTPFLTTKETGTGLGLPVCYRIAARHSAIIEVETTETGTTFFVRFNISKLRIA